MVGRAKLLRGEPHGQASARRFGAALTWINRLCRRPARRRRYNLAMDDRNAAAQAVGPAIRAVRPEDAPRLVAAVDLCSPDDVRLRFCAGLSHLPLELARRFAEGDDGRHAGLVAEGADGAILGAARLDFDAAGDSAEYSILVRSDQQGHGLGGRLLSGLLAQAAARGAREVWGDVARDNSRMLELAEALGFRREQGEDPWRWRMVWNPSSG